MRLRLVALVVLLATAAAAAAPLDGVYVSDPALCAPVAAGDYGQVSATDGVAVAPRVGVIGGDFRCNFGPADDPDAATAKCLGQHGLYEDYARFIANGDMLEAISDSGHMETADGGTQFFRCRGVRDADFPLWDGVEH